jgi:hypothetical protein
MITLIDIKATSPCWTDDKLEARVPKEGVSYMDIAIANDVSLSDRRWLMTQLAAKTAAGRNLIILWAAECAQSVQHNIPDGPLLDASLAAIAAAVACAENNTEETRTAAKSAADAAYTAWSATAAAWSATAAARSAAYAARSAADAAGVAAAAGSADAARSAARSAAGSADAAGAAGAAEAKQLIDLANALAVL